MGTMVSCRFAGRAARKEKPLTVWQNKESASKTSRNDEEKSAII